MQDLDMGFTSCDHSTVDIITKIMSWMLAVPRNSSPLETVTFQAAHAIRIFASKPWKWIKVV